MRQSKALAMTLISYTHTHVRACITYMSLTTVRSRFVFALPDAAKKAERSKETEQKQSLYKNNMMKAAFTD